MEKFNQTTVKYFIITGISESPILQAPIFLLVLLLYLVTLGGNMIIVLLICLDHHLHTPMYYFLCNLSVLDFCCSTVTLHRILSTFVTGERAISYLTCIAHMYFFGSFICDELLFLTAMSYDRYVAICNPLRYTQVMNGGVCLLLSIVCWILGFLEMIPFIVLISRFTCYKSNIINHFFCDTVEVFKLSCSDTSIFNIVLVTEGLILLCLLPFLLKCISYVFIISTIMKIRSNFGRRKAFYTCSSHITVVILLYATLCYQYQRPSTTDGLDYNKLFSLFNTAALPILNPMIYSFKNKDVKSAFRRQCKYLITHAACNWHLSFKV
ncbi:PREDICTED: olfactory receptor 146-like [Nanorana parkeri]|uniref:olfactory receptor 146-like n=1 Tax=Nanorana parkeri TaxID=125878 RepID=UPI000853FE8F|nr:PREDICTED: olfactory receptor 146-like [Nanorana parkeri]